MSIVDLLALFAEPESLAQLSLSQKMVASLVTTLLGMGITFLALVILQVVITLMARLSSAPAVQAETESPTGGIEPHSESRNEEGVGQEVVAAITVSLALMLERSPESLVIRNIRKADVPVPVWNRAGLAEHMQNNV